MNIILGVIVGLLALMLLVTLHEFGHFIMARKNGVDVTEFGIGFPPRIIAWVKTIDKSTKKSQWVKLPKSEWDKPQKNLVFSLNWLPIGGFCAMKGESDSDTAPHSFGQASFLAKTKILLGGVLMNWLTAFIILTILAVTGMPHFMDHQFQIPNDTTTEFSSVTVTTVESNSPAEKAGIQTGDIISAIDQQPIHYTSELINYNQQHAAETLTYTIIRNDQSQDLQVTLNPTTAPHLLGVSLGQTGQTLSRSTWSAPIVGAVTTVQLTGETFRGLGELVWKFTTGIARQASFDSDTREAGREDIGEVGDSMSGPVGIIGLIFPSFVSAGPTNLAFLVAIISISLACMNVLPIPALDGGRWLLIAIYRLRKKPLTKDIEMKIVSRAFIFLFGLIFVITILDIWKLFS